MSACRLIVPLIFEFISIKIVVRQYFVPMESGAIINMNWVIVVAKFINFEIVQLTMTNTTTDTFNVVKGIILYMYVRI